MANVERMRGHCDAEGLADAGEIGYFYINFSVRGWTAFVEVKRRALREWFFLIDREDVLGFELWAGPLYVCVDREHRAFTDGRRRACRRRSFRGRIRSR